MCGSRNVYTRFWTHDNLPSWQGDGPPQTRIPVRGRGTGRHRHESLSVAGGLSPQTRIPVRGRRLVATEGDGLPQARIPVRGRGTGCHRHESLSMARLDRDASAAQTSAMPYGLRGSRRTRTFVPAPSDPHKVQKNPKMGYGVRPMTLLVPSRHTFRLRFLTLQASSDVTHGLHRSPQRKKLPYAEHRGAAKGMSNSAIRQSAPPW